MFNHRIIAITYTNFMSLLQGIPIADDGKSGKAMPVTIHEDNLVANDTLDDFINV